MDYRGSQIFVSCSESGLRGELVEFLRGIEYETYGIDGPVGIDASERRGTLVFLERTDGNDHEWKSMAGSFEKNGSECFLIALGEDSIPDGFQGAIGGPAARYREGIIGYLGGYRARGHRRYVRFGNLNASIAMFEFHRDGTRFAGIIHDISAAGCSCTFKPEPEVLGHVEVKDMGLSLPGHSTTLSGRFVSRRLFAGQVIHVFLFSEGLPAETVENIHDFIYASLETKLSYR